MTDYTARDIAIVRELIASQQGSSFFEMRKRRNVDRDRPPPTPERFWMALVGCLLTTQQRSGPGSPVNRFLCQVPFPLRLCECLRVADVERFALETIQGFGGIRFGPKISKYIRENLARLQGGLMEYFVGRLLVLDKSPSQPGERDLARELERNLKGIGPKQSRNLIQWLGCSLYEIPLDARLTRWVKANLSLDLGDVGRLSYSRHYEKALDRIQGLCEAAGVYPCLFDAAVFASFDEGRWTDANLAASLLLGA